MTTAPHTRITPLAPFIKTAEDGTHFLAGSRCESCGHTYVGERRACARCCARDRMAPVRLAETGTVYAYTIVYRSFPGVKTPFIDVTVDLDNGAHIRGTLEGVDAVPSALRFDMPVKVAFREAVPVNTPGHPYLTYYFVPA